MTHIGYANVRRALASEFSRFYDDIDAVVLEASDWGDLLPLLRIARNEQPTRPTRPARIPGYAER